MSASFVVLQHVACEPPAVYERLRAVRAAVDPHGLMVSNHPVPATA